jgi:serine/threonine protein kinase
MNASGQSSVSAEAALTESAFAPPVIPDHELLRHIGRGSYGEVWLARNVLGSLRAVKVVYRESFDHDKPYDREFDGLKQFEPISHARESQVDIFHVGRNDAVGCFYYIMELADAAGAVPASDFEISDASRVRLETENHKLETYIPRTLKHDLRARGALPVSECVKIALSLTSALEHLHSHGLVHRDIKPSNIIFVKGVPKLADIGLVTSVDATRSFVGTDGYIPPEGPGTPQADLYSLGKVLYECVTGKDRFDFPELPADWRTRPDFDQLLEFNEILTRVCDSQTNQRHSSARKMGTELEILKGGGSVKRLQARARRRAAGAKALLVLAVAALAAGSFWVLGHHFARQAYAGDAPLSRVEAANVLCDRALRIVRSDDYERFALASTNLQKAIELDPKFALPYVGLLELGLRENSGDIRTSQEFRSILRHLEELAPDLAATHCLRSIMSFRDLDFVQARTEARKAIVAGPNYQFGHTAYGWMLMAWGWPEKAREELQKSRQLNQSKMAIEDGVIANTYYAERNYRQALHAHLEALQLNPRLHLALIGASDVYRAMGDYTNSINFFQQSLVGEGQSEAEAKRECDGLRQAFAQGSERGYWEEWQRRSEKHPNFERYWKAVYKMELGDKRAALGLLNEALRIHRQPEGFRAEPNLQWLLFHHFWDPLRGDPEFVALLNKVGLSKVMPGIK